MGIELNIHDQAEWTLQGAVIQHKLLLIEYMLVQGAKLNSKEKDWGYTVLHEAARSNRVVLDLITIQNRC